MNDCYSPSWEGALKKFRYAAIATYHTAAAG